MIKIEMININGRDFKKTYSDENKYIQKVGTNEKYAEAIDVLDFEYVETEQEILNSIEGE